MAPSKLRKAIGAVKDTTSIGLAKVSSSTALGELEVSIVKATRHDEYPSEEKHLRDIINLTSFSRTNIAASVSLLTRRLAKTRSWAVALKTLILVHRLIADGDPAYEEEVFFATRCGTRMLNMTDFRDAGGAESGGWEYSAFVRTYARYLDERLEYRMMGRRMKGVVSAAGRKIRWQPEEEEGEGRDTSMRSTPVREMRTDRLFVRAHHLQKLLDRFLDSRPTGAAKLNRIVAMALYPMVKESFQIYFDLAEIIANFVDRFMELPITDCVRIHDLFSRLSKQLEELKGFYSWSLSAGVARASDYPEIDHITHNKLNVMDEFIRERNALAISRVAPDDEPQAPITHDMNRAKALPSAPQLEEVPKPEEHEELTEPTTEAKEEKAEGKELAETAPKQLKEEVDFLNQRADAPTMEQYGDSLALAQFDSSGDRTAGEAQPWQAFEEAEDWEKALVESTTNLAGQKSVLAGGFDMLMLDEMYSQVSAACDAGGGGSGSSIAVLGPGKLGMLALPAPETGSRGGSADPFAASATVPPPAWVQMSEMERKQHLVMEEQLMWRQYARDGMQGRLPNIYPMGGYPQWL